MTMTHEIPVRWLETWAETDPDRIALVTPEGEVTYKTLADLVHGRTELIASGLTRGDVVPIRSRLDLSTVVTLLATSAVGGVPMPYVDEVPDIALQSPTDAAMCVVTSGSSGRQRIVRLTSRNIEAAVLASRVRLRNDADDRWLLCLPLHHVGGLSVLWRSFEAGGSVAMAPFDPGLPRFMAAARPTLASMVPTMVYRLLRADPDDLASLRFTLVGGARTTPELLTSANRAGVALVRSYGSTETTSQIATSEPGGDPVATHVGPPLDGVEVSIVGEDRREVLPGTIGEITVAGHIVSPGYLAEPDRVGPLFTGDLGSIDHSGRLSVHGRVDDRIVSGGENVFLSTVSDAVDSIDGVVDALAVGVADPEWGTAVVVVAESTRSVQALDLHARELLRPHEVPKRWVIVDSLPLLPNGKHDLAAVHDIARHG